ncbi:MAG: phenylalanine--tRNA ligase subunit beta [Bacteroidota bacterium]
MKISFNWIRELVALPAAVTADEAARRLTLAGLEVESIERRGREVTGVRVAEVRSVRPHPGAEKLRIVRLAGGDAGIEEDVVCGAPNVPGPGGRVVWAPPGATLPGGLTLGRKEIRGFESPGMICSERELGIGDGVDGILILSTDAPVGADVAGLLGIADDVFEVNVTPNRADALSHAGVAREIAALFGVGWSLPPVPATALVNAAGAVAVTVDIADAQGCPRYLATVIRGVRVGPSPLAMRMRLGACGVRPISNLVDVTNYVMLETGHPLHAFDLDKLDPPAGGIVVRRATAGEGMRTLDGVDRKLETGDIVIADARKPVALAGLMGGASSEVSETTTNVLLEAATFDPRAVRRTAKRLGLHSEASHRFERGVDAEGVPVAAALAAARMAALGGGHIAGVPVDRYVSPVVPRQVSLTAKTLRRVAGFDIPAAIVADKLRGIGIASVAQGADLSATVPTFRPDIAIEEDLIEEVMRLVGYDQVPARLPSGGKAPEPSPQALADRARDILAALGLHEIATWAFVSRAALEALGDPDLARAIAVKNPISADYEVMRTSLLPGLADAARRNITRGMSDVRLFEVGPVVRPAPGDQHHVQSIHAAGLLTGRGGGWLKPGEPVDFFDLKRVVCALLDGLGVGDPVFAPVASASAAGRLLHPGVSAEISVPGAGEGGALGFAGEVHPALARRLGLDAQSFVFHLALEPLENSGRSSRAVAPPRFPAVTRDVSFLIAAATSSAAQRLALAGAGESLLRHIAVLEDFRDARFVTPGKKGMLWTLTYRADDRTLTDAEVDAAHARVVAALAKAFPIEIR